MTDNQDQTGVFFTSISIENFKTYPRVYLTDMKCDNIFAIIGNNGNGKSNLIDAFLYGLGESSLEKLRVRKIAELIHHKAARCSVKVVLTVDTSTLLTFERCTTRKGSSFYYINSKVTAAAYNESLRKSGVDVNAKAFAVQQGTIQEVALKDGTELIEFIEKICGSYNYKPEYEAKQNETLELSEKLTKLKRNLAQYKLQNKKVKKSRTSIARRNEITTRIEDLNIRVNLAQILQLNQDINIHDVKKNQLNATIEQLTGELETSKEALIAKQTQIMETSVELHQKMPQFEISNQKYQSADMDANNVKQEMNALLDQIKSIENGISMHNETIQNGEEEINKLEVELQKAATEVTSTPDISLQESQIHGSNMRSEYTAIKQRVTEIISGREDLLDYEGTNKEQYNRMVIEAEQFRNTKNIKLLEAEEKVLASQTDEITEEIIDIAGKERELQAIESRYNKARNKIEEIKTSNIVVDPLQNFELNGIGRLHNFYTLRPPASPNAINVTFGTSMQAIIVEEANTIKEFITNRNNFPHEKFIPLDKVKYEEEPTEPDAMLLTHCLEYEEQFESVFGSVSKNVAIIDGPPTSDIISRKFGVVTKDGTFYSKNGFVKSLKYSQRSQSFTQDVEKLLNDYREIRSELREKQIEFAQLKQKQYEAEIIKEVRSDNPQQATIEELREQRNLLQSENEELARQLNEFEVNRDIYKNSIETIENDLFKDFCIQYNFENIQVYERIIDPNYAINNQNKIKVTEINEQIDRLKTKISRVQERRHDLTIILESLNTNKRDCDINLNNVQECREECRTNLNQLQSIITELRARLTDLEIEKSRLGKVISRKKSKVKECNQTLTKTLHEEKNILQKRHECLLKCKVNNIKLPTTDESSASQYLENDTNIDTLHSIESLLPLDFDSLPREIRQARSLPNVVQLLQSDLKCLVQEQAKLQIMGQTTDQSLIDIGNELTSLNHEYQNAQKEYNECTKALNVIENKRSELLQDCLDFVLSTIGSVYKNLYGNGKTNATATCILGGQKEIFLGPLYYLCTVPGKKPYPMNLLSTGEKTMASLALICTLILYKKLSLAVFDEVDASLDPERLTSFLKYLNELKKNKQIMLITHNAYSMAECDEIIGITSNQTYSREIKTSELIRVRLDSYLPSVSECPPETEYFHSPGSISSISSVSPEY